MIKLGDNSIGRVYLGNNEIGKAYLGSNLVFQKDSTPRPVFHSKLVFDGTAYIDTDILFPENGSIRIPLGYETEKKLQTIFNAGGRVYTLLNNSTNDAARCFTSSYDSSSALISGTTLTLSWNYDSYSFFQTPQRVGFGDKTEQYTKGTSRPSTGIVFGQNAAHTSSPYTGTINGWVRIYGSDAQNAAQYSDLNNYTPVYTLRPCTYRGEAGLWCVETSTFYGNSAGAGQLTVAD